MNTLSHPSCLSHINSTVVRYLNRQSLSMMVGRAGMAVASKIAPRFAVKQAVEKFLTPPRFVRPLTETRLLANAAPFLVGTPNGNIAAWRFGNVNDPIVLLSHGWGGRGAQFRNFVQPLLDDCYQVVLFDHLGHGESDGRDSSLVMFWRGLEAVQAHLAGEGHAVFGLVSHSLGGAAVGCALRSHGRRTPFAHKAVMIAPPSSLIGYSNVFAHYMGITERIRHAMQWRIEQRYGVAWRTFELPDAVNTITTPALIIHDHDDRMVPIESGMAVARAWTNARFHATRKLGHQRILRNREVVQHTIDFLSDRVKFQRPPALGERAAYCEVPQPAPLY